MAGIVVLFCVSLILSAVGSDATGELTILYSPRSLTFTGSNTALESSIKDIFSAALGLSVEEDSKWNGLKITDPFDTPEAVVEVYIDGVSSLGESANLKGPKYPIKVDEYEPDTYGFLSYRIKQRYVDGNNNLVNVKLSNAKELSSHFDLDEDTETSSSKTTYKYLKSEIPEDEKFLMELQALKDITEKVKSGFIAADNFVDFYNFRFRSLHGLVDYHGPTSLPAKEAKKLLGEELENLSAAFVKAYDGSVLVTAVTTDVAHTRRAARSVRAERDTYPENYAPIFNILLWFGIIFVFTMIAIVYALIDMDPGRDSIIYRMTSTRIKKEN